jgi:hypothetical protein
MNKNEILHIYFRMAFTSENYMKWLEKPNLKKADIEEITSLLNIYNKKLATMEDENPWIANVLVAMEGT